MSNHDLMTSSFVEVPEDKLDAARAVCEEVVEILLASEDGYVGIEWEVQPKGVWLYEQSSANTSHLEFFVRSLVEKLQLPGIHLCSWAFTCSKPLVDEFGGGAIAVQMNRPTVWIDAITEAEERAKKMTTPGTLFFYGQITTHYGEFEEQDRFCFAVPPRLTEQEVQLRIASGFRCAIWPADDDLYWFDGYAHEGVDCVREMSPEEYEIVKKYLPHYDYGEDTLVERVEANTTHDGGTVRLKNGYIFNWALNDQFYPGVIDLPEELREYEFTITEDIMGYLLVNNLRPNLIPEDLGYED